MANCILKSTILWKQCFIPTTFSASLLLPTSFWWLCNH